MKRVYTDDPHLNVEDLPRQTTRRAGDNKRRNDTQDIIDLYKLLDALDTDFPLPIFTAAFLKRLPPFQPDATDFCSLASSVEFLQFQMADVLKRLKSLGHAGSGVGIAGSRHSGGGAGSGVGGAIGMGSSFSSNNNHAEVENLSMGSIELSGGRLPVGNPGGLVNGQLLGGAAGGPQGGPSGLLGQVGSSWLMGPAPPSGWLNCPIGGADLPPPPPGFATGQSFGQVNHSQQPGQQLSWLATKQQPHGSSGASYAAAAAKPAESRVLGSRSCGRPGLEQIKTIPRRITAFVGRMHIDTTEDELVKFLSDAGLHDIKCTKLKIPVGKSFKTAAFCVSCPETCKDTFYRDNTWPDGAEVRDWHFKSRTGVQGQHETQVKSAF